MTAIVGILNKQAIAVAADSAVTVGGGMKIYNTANKLFTLSKRHPVGVAIYNNASYNGCVPWEVVIKMYRNQLQDKHFPTVREYAANLIAYLDDFRAKFYKQEDLNKVLSSDVFTFWMANIVQNLPHNNRQSSSILKEDLVALKSNITSLKDSLAKSEKITQIEEVDIESFKASICGIWPEIQKQIEAAGGKYQELENDIKELLFLAFTRKGFEHPFYSGLAVFGYGEDEVYPSLYEFRIHNTFVDKPYVEECGSAIVAEPPSNAFIRPMAQMDVIQTYIEGISPQIEKTFIDSTIQTMRATLDAISKTVETSDRKLANQIRAIDLTPVIQSYANSIGKFKQDHIVAPLIRTVASMGKEDIAELAENLIYVTSMKRHITPNLESVGGPVDVAVVSKGDGFIWMKRKHYFDPQLNSCFFENYFENNK